MADQAQAAQNQQQQAPPPPQGVNPPPVVNPPVQPVAPAAPAVDPNIVALAAQVTNLTALINNYVASHAPAPVSMGIDLFDGDAIDVNTRAGQALLLDAKKSLHATFSGKLEELHPFLVDLKQ